MQVFKRRVCFFRPYEYSGKNKKLISLSALRKDAQISLCGLHPLVTMDNISAIAPDFELDDMDYKDYDPSEPYFYGDVVLYQPPEGEKVLLKALVDNPSVIVTGGDFNNDFSSDFRNQEDGGQSLEDLGQDWAVTTPFSEWIESKVDISIRNMIQSFIRTKLVKGETRLMCEHKTMFEGAGRLVDREKNKNNLAGFEINPIRSGGVTIKIDKIGLQFTKKGTYKLYLMHSSQSEPIRTLTVEKKNDMSFEWFSFDDLYLPYSSETIAPGGSWYLCYDQTELPDGSEAVIKNKDWSKAPCSGCSRSEFISWQAWSKYIEIHPFLVGRENVERNEQERPLMWDVFYNTYRYDSNFGLNLEVSVDCDITEIITKNASAFDDVLGLQLAVDWLKEFMFNANARANRNSANAGKSDIILALEGDKSLMSGQGLSARLESAYKAVNISFDTMDKVCMTCTNNGVKYRTV